MALTLSGPGSCRRRSVCDCGGSSCDGVDDGREAGEKEEEDGEEEGEEEDAVEAQTMLATEERAPRSHAGVSMAMEMMGSAAPRRLGGYGICIAASWRPRRGSV